MVENKEKRIIKFQLTITLILTLIVCITTATYAYYAVGDTNNNTITGNMATVDLTLSVEKIFPTENSNNTGVIVPQLSNNNALGSALKGACVDQNANIACQVYKIDVSNNGGTAKQVVNGYAYFYSEPSLIQDVSTAIPNLKWRLVESVDETTPNQSVLGNNTNNAANANGEAKIVSDLTMATNSTYTYYMIVWLNEINEDQPTETDKEFYGKIEFEASNGNGVTAVFGNNQPAIDDTPYTVTFNPNGGTVSTSTKQVTIGQKYGSLPTPTREGYTFKGWNGKNLFDSSKATGKNATIVNGVVNQIKADTRENRQWKLQVYNDDTYVKQLRFLTYNSTGIISFHFAKENTFNIIKFGVNGSQRDTTIFYNVGGLTNNQTYTLSFNATNITQGSISWNNIQLEEGAETTEYEPYYVTSGTKVTQAKNHTLTAIWEEN